MSGEWKTGSVTWPGQDNDQGLTPDEAAKFRFLVMVAVRDGVDEAIEPFLTHIDNQLKVIEQRMSLLNAQNELIIRALQMMAEGDEELSTSNESDHVDMSGRPIL